jgi:hypothetical protein
VVKLEVMNAFTIFKDLGIGVFFNANTLLGTRAANEQILRMM